jgi:hypothetical protein
MLAKRVLAPSAQLLTGASSTYPWIFGPAFDLIFCCGGAVWLLFILQEFARPLAGAIMNPVMTAIVILSAHPWGEMHISATLFRIYESADSRKRHSVLCFWLAALAVLMFVCGTLVPELTGAYLRIYFLWIVQHYVGQSYGFVLLSAIKEPISWKKLISSCLQPC